MGAVLLMTLLLRRAFCGFMCPIGTISEWLQAGARRLGLKPIPIPYALDRVLSLLKYPVLAIILYITYKSGELLFRGFDPCYVLISRHGKDITMWSYVAAGGIVVASLFMILPFCRWLCPLAAVLNPFSAIGLARVKRDSETCVDCGLCAPACPMGIKVDKLEEVTAARCTSCLDCVAVCPKSSKGALTWGPPRMLGRRWPSGLIVVIMLACVGAAVAATYAFPLPSYIETIGEQPQTVASVRYTVDGVTCRGSSSRIIDWLHRDDEFAVPGYLKIETWPAPKNAGLRITFDPSQTSADAVRQALSEASLNLLAGEFEFSPYEIVAEE